MSASAARNDKSSCSSSTSANFAWIFVKDSKVQTVFTSAEEATPSGETPLLGIRIEGMEENKRVSTQAEVESWGKALIQLLIASLGPQAALSVLTIASNTKPELR